MTDFDLLIEQIKQLRSLAATARQQMESLQKLEDQFLARAEEAKVEALAAARQSEGWHRLADQIFAGAITDHAAAEAALTRDQRKGNNCFVCAGVITDAEPDECLGPLGDIYVFAHVDADVCKRTLAGKAVTL